MMKKFLCVCVLGVTSVFTFAATANAGVMGSNLLKPAPTLEEELTKELELEMEKLMLQLLLELIDELWETDPALAQQLWNLLFLPQQ